MRVRKDMQRTELKTYTGKEDNTDHYFRDLFNLRLNDMGCFCHVTGERRIMFLLCIKIIALLPG
jgi:hypothetical protein